MAAALAMAFALTIWLASAPTALASDCQPAAIFEPLLASLPVSVGACSGEPYLSSQGDLVQPTSRGLLVRREPDQRVAFTDGTRTWIDGPLGLQLRLNIERFAWETNPGSLSETSSRGIVVALGAQQLIAYQDGEPVLRTAITTGGPNSPTPIGSYAILAKRTSWVMKSPWARPDPRWYPDSFINYSLLFERSGYFIHDAPWRSVYGPGSNLLSDPETGWLGSHGCVNVPFTAEQRLFGWTAVGTLVTVQA